MNNFYKKIEKFNKIYNLPCNTEPTLLPKERIANFMNILAEEVREGSEIIKKYDNGDHSGVMVDMADWLCDIIVYCASEAKRWGIPAAQVLDIIMESNFSKLGPDGQPIYDERGKVLKGPGYWRPEPLIYNILQPAATQKTFRALRMAVAVSDLPSLGAIFGLLDAGSDQRIHKTIRLGVFKAPEDAKALGGVQAAIRGMKPEDALIKPIAKEWKLGKAGEESVVVAVTGRGFELKAKYCLTAKKDVVINLMDAVFEKSE